MEVKGINLNTMYVERTEEGINLYGSHYSNELKMLTVVKSTKNMENLARDIYGSHYSNEAFIEKLRERPTHNFIGRLCGPISMPISAEHVRFVE